ncbi:hypothetical protein B7P43_G08969 [Cryptotermes secundus]|uniref:Uncharacterized protein n=1 Tax=Cryptotermes secundus TaxID=105785 RepID=A0A2J7PSA9_9NEOP|nr:hypothetical protein B7P43_G08969 [Cryptotermes secundus]
MLRFLCEAARLVIPTDTLFQKLLKLIFTDKMELRKPEAFVLIFMLLVTLCTAVNPTSAGDSPVSTGALSRKKRYLTFPPGSILQLGYCLTIPAIIPDGIWTYGITFGTNWEIPTDPVGLKAPKDAEVVHRRQRRDLYQKLRPMMDTMGLDGDSCILRALCESGQRPQGSKGSFLEEILHIIFTMGLDGHECILRALCESGRRKTEKGTFLQEILYTIFTQGEAGRICIYRALCEAKYFLKPGRSFIEDIMYTVFRYSRANGELELDPEGYEIAEGQESCVTWSRECPYSLLQLLIS